MLYGIMLLCYHVVIELFSLVKMLSRNADIRWLSSAAIEGTHADTHDIARPQGLREASYSSWKL
jgi:hypothetical protein